MDEFIAGSDPTRFMESLRHGVIKKHAAETVTLKEMSDARKKEITEKMDKAHYQEYHQRQNQKK